MYKSILVAIESMQVDQPALSAAVQVAKRSAARLHIVHVSEGPRSNLERSALLRAAEWTSEELGESVSFELIELQPGRSVADHILGYAARHDIDFLVMGTHGRGRLARLLVGSVADAVLRSCEVPVLLVPRGGRRFKMRRLLIPLDGTPEAERVLEDATTMAQLFGSSITLVQAIESEYAARRDRTGKPLPLAHEEFVLRSARSEEYLERTADRLRRRGVEVETATLAGQELQTVVKNAADAVHPDMIGLAPKPVGRSARMARAGLLDRLLKRTDSALLLRPRPQSTGLWQRTL